MQRKGNSAQSSEANLLRLIRQKRKKGTKMTVTKESRDAAAAEASKTDDAHDAKRMGRLDVAEIAAINANRHDPRIELAEVMFGVIRSKDERIKELISTVFPSIKFGDTPDDDPAGLPAPKASRRSEWAPVYQSDGVTIATDIEKVRFDDAATQRDRGLVPMEDSDGNVVAFRKRPTPVSAPTASANPAPDNNIQVVDSKGKPVQKITLAKFKAGSFDIVDTDDEGRPTKVAEKSSRRGGWRSSK